MRKGVTLPAFIMKLVFEKTNPKIGVKIALVKDTVSCLHDFSCEDRLTAFHPKE